MHMADTHAALDLHPEIFFDAEVEADAETEAVINEQLAPFREQLREVVGQTATTLNRTTILEALVDNLIADAYLDLTGPSVAFSRGWRYGAPVPPGEVTAGNLWQMIPIKPGSVHGRDDRQRNPPKDRREFAERLCSRSL